ncbi:transcription repressor NadR [Clostridium sp. NSJ-49]|jgi:transcriptional regulator of NAD metabolism|uniref:Transcriptional regulator n=1 Tax=Clostridium disporicum TaxID=84024 RepID=A0A174LZ91_9CLOT|nr:MULTISPECIES: transcription repressor NadR [Clostridium]MBC5627213.1 transcription repressor NadR [Clostridium sp. NSJ-49]MCD2503319.1 transcription repressor NadR [Clostridium sp. NSJ-145]CUP27040.1 transcriptional regulator [Clostridium disporicum]
MIANNRREAIVELLLKEKAPVKGVELATKFDVTRQIIVKDIAILRAKGNNIIATPDGYMFNDDNGSRVRAIIAVNHNKDEMIKELEIVIKYGGIIEDVIVEHPIYGEIKGLLMIKNLNDLNRFKNTFELSDSAPLSSLTNGVHLHTVSVDTKENMELIKKELKENGLTL